MYKVEKEEYFIKWESEFYDVYKEREELDDEDFKSIAVGFFIAKGLTLDEAYKMYSFCISKGKY
jgi:hypothetical protein